jgi:hypothetical protein
MDARHTDTEVVSASGCKLDSKESIAHESTEASSAVEKTFLNETHPEPAIVPSSTTTPIPVTDKPLKSSTENDSAERQSFDLPHESLDESSPSKTLATSVKTVAEYDAELAQLRSDNEVAELRRQEETHSYTERIDALESKLQYLCKETVESARKAAADAPSGSVDKRLAEKDEQIALLMEEGQKLSRTELKQMNTIKKLRAKLRDVEQSLTEARKKLEKSEKDALHAKEVALQAESSEKRAAERTKTISRLEKELEKLSIERDANNATIAGLKSELKAASLKASDAEVKAQSDAIEAEKRVTQELRDDLTSSKIERQLVEDRLRNEVKDLKVTLDREKQRNNVLEMEMKSEQAVSC